tara:strand:+ start:16437 stop:18659 length:2223 start_codon:yes stop_codon:yes gene_type:complete
MATEFISNSWLMPENSNQDKLANYSLTFDGSSQYVNLGNVYDNIFTSSNFTVSTWIYSTGNTSYDNFFNKGTTVQFYLVSNKIQIYLSSSSSGIWPLESTATLSLNTWYNIVFTRSGNENKLYINGTLDNSATSTGSISASTGSLTFSSYNGGSSYFWEGKLTEYSIFDYALSASQVTQVYGTGSAVGNPMAITNGRKPVAYYPLGQSAFNGEFLASNGAEKDYVFNFTGSSEHILLPQVNTTGAITISCWIKSTGADYQMIYNEDEGIRSPAGSNRNFFYTLAFGKLRWSVWFTTGLVTVNSSNNINDGNWHHTLGVWDGTTNTGGIKLFIDGILQGSGTAGSTTRVNNTMANNSSIIGGQYSSFDFDGSMSNFQVYTTGLSYGSASSSGDVAGGEVATLYNYGTPYKGTQPQLDNLKVWYELDASATFSTNWSIPDASSNSNTGTSSGMTVANLVQSDLIINAPFDSFALDFDGTDDNIEATKLGLTTAISVSAWVKTTTTSGTRIIVNEDDWGSNRNWHLYIAGSNKVLFRVYGASGQIAFIIRATAGEITDGNWHHVCATWDGTTNTNGIQLSIDNDIETATATGTGINTDNVDLAIGSASNSSSTNSLSGTVSNVSIYNTGLTSAQVTTLYNEGKPFDLNTFAVTPVSWWRLGAVNSSFDGTNFTVLDEISTSGNNGTSANMTQADLVDGVGATGSGTSSGMSSGTNKVGNSPYSDNNAVSYNMSVTAKSTSVPT